MTFLRNAFDGTDSGAGPPSIGRVRRFTAIGVVVAAPLALAVAGLVHPHGLTGSTAAHWEELHIWLLPVFPLVGLGFVVPLWGRPGRDLAGVASVVAWLAAFGYACFYTGLDAVAGIAAGSAARHAPPGADLGRVAAPLFDTGDRLGRIGVYAFLVAVVAASVALLLRHGIRVLPGSVVLLIAGYSFVDSHIFWPRGVVTMLGFAVGFGWLAGIAGAPTRAGGPSPVPGHRSQTGPSR